MYLPEYLKNIQPEIKAMVSNCETALETIEASHEYNNPLHPFHAAAVATYNHLTTVVLRLDGLEA